MRYSTLASVTGQTEDHIAIVRRATDGILGHVCLEVKVDELG